MFSLLRLVPLSFLGMMARFISYFARLANASIYRSIRTNLMLVRPFLSQKERDELAYQALQNQLTSTLDSAKSWVMPPKWSIRQITKIHNEAILQAGLSHPNGMLIIVPHLGTWEMMNAWVSQFGKLTIMYKPVKNLAMNELMLQGRARLDATLVPTDATGVKAIFKTLKSGGFSVLLPDHVPDKNGGEITPFFGIPTMTGTLASKLAQKTQCKLIGMSCIKTNNGFEIFCYDLDDKNLYHRDSNIATSALNHAMERMINEHFTHYMWGYRRFKTTPFGENPYLLSFEELHEQVKKYKQEHP